MPTLASQASLSSMAKHPLLLLLAVWVLAGGLWLEAEAQGAPYGVKLCGLELARTIKNICKKIHWRRSDNLAQEAMEGALPDPGPYADRRALYGSPRGT